MVEWVQVLSAMVDGPSAPVTGVVSPDVPDDQRTFTFGWAGQPPLVVNTNTPVRMWRHGYRLRAELLSGEPAFRTDGSSAWQFSNGECVRAPLGRVLYVGPGDVLIRTRSANEWTGSDFTRPTDRPIREIDFLGRPCWEVELAPPSHKPAPIQLVVDVATGTVLEQRNDAFATRVSYIEFAVVDPPSTDFFQWDGPATSIEERDALMRAERDRATQKGVEWFREHVSAEKLQIPVSIELEVQDVRQYTEDGSFEATVGSPRSGIRGILARRPRGSESWPLRWENAEHLPATRWSTPDYDWALGMYEHMTLDTSVLHRLQNLLHPGFPAQPSTYPSKP